MNTKIHSIVTAAMLAAMTTVATMIIKVPTIGTNGYVNIGDSIVLASAWLLGNPYGALAAGIGSALADLLSGYPVYVPGTAVIKFLMAFVCAILTSLMKNRKIPVVAACIVSSLAAEIIMILGYFLYEATILGYGFAAAASIGSNAIQAGVCMVLGNLLYHALSGIRKGVGLGGTDKSADH